jgi:hypothetical protein
MRLKVAAESTDWAAELASLHDAGELAGSPAPGATDDADVEVDRFRILHSLLVAAVEAVVQASEGEICYLV